MEKKIKIPTKEERRIELLELDNADLWYENILKDNQLVTANQEIADLWYQIIVGGNV